MCGTCVHGNALLEVMFANVHVLLAVMDRNFTLLRVNAAFCAMDGRPAEALIGRNHFELYPDADNEQIFTRVRDSGERCSVLAKPFTYPHRPELGVTYWDWTVSPMHGRTGDVDGLILTLVNVTEQELHRQEIERVRQGLERRVRDRTLALEAVVAELEAFSYCVSHDLSAPLRAINGYATLLSDEFSDQLPDAATDYLARIRQASARMDQLMAGLLQLNRVSRAEVTRVEVELKKLGAEVMTNLAQEQPGREVEYVSTTAQPAHMDRDMARILLTNLLGNAWKFTGRATRARIELGSIACCGEVIHYVRDNGVGFDMASAGRICDAFERLHGQEFPGSGIGLATAARIVRAHGGRIWAEAKEGEGATFFFTMGSNSGSGDGACCSSEQLAL